MPEVEGKLPEFIDTHHPYTWFYDHVSLWYLRRLMHTGYHSTLRILAQENIPVYRFQCPSQCRYLIPKEYVQRLKTVYGSDAARARRLSHTAAKRKGAPLSQACPHCGKKGRQWRACISPAGKQQVRCGHCKGNYTIGRRPPLQATCVHCGNTTHQTRTRLTSAGNRQVRCAHCKRSYTLQGNPDAALAPPDPSDAWAALACTTEVETQW